MVNVNLEHAILSNTKTYQAKSSVAAKERELRYSDVPFFVIIFFRIQVDVYSFGVLLCEICIQEMPDPDRRDEQVAMVTNRRLRALIRRCLQRDPETRPSMEYIIGKLEKPDSFFKRLSFF